MNTYKYIYGPVPSRRLGLSLGISPIPKKYCNYACIYCQLGRTDHLTNTRASYFPVADLLDEFRHYIETGVLFDVVTIVGEGEPLLFADLGTLINELKQLTTQPIAVITNGALLSSLEVRNALENADIVLPSFDAYDSDSFKRINRPHGSINFDEVYQGLIHFSETFHGQIWLEIMLIKNVNDDLEALQKFKSLLANIRYDRLFINTPVRPPAEAGVEEATNETLATAISILGGTSIEHLTATGFFSDIQDDYEAISSIIKRHPMNQYEITHFLETRNCLDTDAIFMKLHADTTVEIVPYKGYNTFRK